MLFVPPLATSLDDLKSRNTAAVNSLDEDTLRDVQDELITVLMLFVQQMKGTKTLIKWFTASFHNLFHHLLFFVIVIPSIPLKNWFE